MEIDDCLLGEQISLLICNKNWKEIIQLGSQLSIEKKSRFLWVWPNESSLIFLKKSLNELNISTILSIGCGSGLLEWLITECTGIEINGIERDKSWWTSKHSTKTFINLEFIDEITKITPDFLRNCVKSNNEFALLFCYFNNKDAFLSYLEAFEIFGKCLIIIGPGEGKNVFTEPLPFDIDVSVNTNWFLWKFCEIGNSHDFIAIYIKNT